MLEQLLYENPRHEALWKLTSRLLNMLESLAGQAAFTSFNTVGMHSISLGLLWISIWQSPLHHRGACEDTEAFPIELYHCFRER